MLCFPLDNTEYEAKALGAWLAARTRGVFSADGNLSVAAVGGLNVTVSPGLSWLKMAEFWGTVCLLESTLQLQLDAADAELPRCDAVCVQLDKNLNTAAVVIKKGVPSLQPEPQAPQRDFERDEIYLACIHIAAGATDITPDNITDYRLNEDFCGLMRDGVSAIPTDVLQTQAQALIQTVADQLARVNTGSEHMLKTEYATTATAEIIGTTLAITSAFSHPHTLYDVRFTMPQGSFDTIEIDGAAMQGVFDAGGDTADFEPAAGVPVTLTRQGTRAFFNQGGAALNFKITASVAQPENPKENTVWVETDTPFSYYIFDATQPSGREQAGGLQEGDLWFSSGSLSPHPMNIAKKNAVKIYPVSVYQFLNGGFVQKQARIFKNGAWHILILSLFESGNTHATLSGGWVGGTVGQVISLGTDTSTSTNNLIDLTGVNTIVVKYYRSTSYEMEFRLGISNLYKTGNYFDRVVQNVYGGGGTGYNQTIELDVSDVTGSYYIKAYHRGFGSSFIQHIYLK